MSYEGVEDARFRSRLKSFLLSLYPQLIRSPDVIDEFTRELSEFGHVWAINYKTHPFAVEEARLRLRQWISQNVPPSRPRGGGGGSLLDDLVALLKALWRRLGNPRTDERTRR